MTVAGIGRVGAWAHLDTLAARDLDAHVRRIEELGYGALWVPETVGREPFALLGRIGALTERLVLGTSIASIWARDPQATRMAALTLSEATDGRFVLGLGVSHPHMAERLHGHTYDHPLARMREYLSAYRSAVWKGPMAIEPPVLLAALRPRMLGLAATAADGAFPYLVTPERVAEVRALLDSSGAASRPTLAVSLPAVLETDPSAARAAARAYLAPYLRVPNYHASWALQGFDASDWEKPGVDRLIDAMVAWGDHARLRARIDALHVAGADHVAIIALAPDGTSEQLPTLEALAG